MSAPRAPGRILTLYSKADCPLCEEAYPLVSRLARRHGLVVETVDIATDPDLLERHRLRIPVLELDGVELGWGRLSERALARRLESLSGESPPGGESRRS